MAKKKEGSKFILALGVGFVAVTLFAFNFLAQTASGGGEDIVVCTIEKHGLGFVEKEKIKEFAK